MPIILPLYESWSQYKRFSFYNALNYLKTKGNILNKHFEQHNNMAGLVWTTNKTIYSYYWNKDNIVFKYKNNYLIKHCQTSIVSITNWYFLIQRVYYNDLISKQINSRAYYILYRHFLIVIVLNYLIKYNNYIIIYYFFFQNVLSVEINIYFIQKEYLIWKVNNYYASSVIW